MKPKKKFILCLVIMVFQISSGQVGIVDQETTNKPTITFIGTYHMGSQGNNVYKGSYDDILLPERQKELKILIEKLKDFEPTKIMLEVDVKYDSIIQSSYTKYLDGKFELKRNEVYQIGFRLAKEMNHKKIYAVDWGIFPKDSLYWYENYAKKDSVQKQFLENIRKLDFKRFEERTKEINKLSIIDRFRLLNSGENIENDHKDYFDIMRIGKKDEYVGANYLSWWYSRNMKILVNIIRATESPEDRILVLYGNGHSKLLNQLTKESRFYDVVNPLEVLKK